MDSYSNKINRIKFTIDEIRDDIEKMKMKNEKAINTMMTSITPNSQSENIDIQNEMSGRNQMYKVNDTENENDNENEEINEYIPKDNYAPLQYMQDNQYEDNNISGTIQTLPDEQKEEIYKKYETVESNGDYYPQVGQSKENNNKLYQREEIVQQNNQERQYNMKEEYNEQNIEYISPHESKKDCDIDQYDNIKVYSSKDKALNKVSNKSPGFNFRQKETSGQKQNITPLLQYRKTEFDSKYAYLNKNEIDNDNDNVNENDNENDNDNDNEVTTKENYNNNNNVEENNNNLTILKLQQEISNLKSQLSLIQNENQILHQEIQKEKQNNELILQKEKEQKDIETQALNDIMNYLNVSSYEEVIPKIESIMTQQNKNQINENVIQCKGNDKLKEELITKLKNLYIELSGAEENESVDIKSIWRWIKHLINTVRSLAHEKENNINIIQELQMSNIYREFCEQLMNQYNFNHFNEFKSFMNNILQSNINPNANANANRGVPIKNQNLNANNFYLNKNQFY